MRYTKDHKSSANADIVSMAGKLIRKRGFAEVGVKDVMSAVGLTHGGFYAHFQSREAMLAKAMESAIKDSPSDFEKLCSLAKANGDAGLIAEYYLSPIRIMNVENGCPAAALLGEIGRQPVAVRDAFGLGAAQVVSQLNTVFGSAEKSWAVLSLLAGALALMRVTDDLATQKTIREGTISTVRILAK